MSLICIQGTWINPTYIRDVQLKMIRPHSHEEKELKIIITFATRDWVEWELEDGKSPEHSLEEVIKLINDHLK